MISGAQPVRSIAKGWMVYAPRLYFEGNDDAHRTSKIFIRSSRCLLEFMIADDYCRRNNIDVYPVDMDLFSFLKLRKIDELIDRQNIVKKPGRR